MNQTKIYAQGSTHTVHNGDLVNYNKMNMVSDDGHKVNLKLDLNGEKYLVRNLDLNNIHHLDKILPKQRQNQFSLYNKMINDFDLMEDDIIRMRTYPGKRKPRTRHATSTKKKKVKRKTVHRTKSPKKSQAKKKLTLKNTRKNKSVKRKYKTKRYSLKPNTFL
jgi:hypothetical protein